MPNNPIDTEKEKALKTIQTKLAGMEGLAYEVFLKSIEDIFDFKAGKFVVEGNFIKQLNKLTVQVLDLLQSEPKFTGPVSQFVKRMPNVSSAITDFQKSTNGIKVPAYETAKKVVIDEIVDKMLDNGLNTAFVQPLRDIVYQNATTGISLKDAKIQIKEFIKGGGDTTGKLSRYLDQTAQQGVDAYSGAINKRLLETFDYDALLMTGSLIDNSSPQCRYVVEGNFIKQLNKLTVQVLDLLQSEPKFTGPVSQFVKRLTPVSEAITDFQKSTNDIKVPTYETAKKVVIDEIIDKMLDNGLNAEFVQPLRDIVYQNATTGISLKDAKIQLKQFIIGGGDKSGKLGSYLEQTAQQGVDAYSGAINKRLLETFDYDALLMTGSLIDNSSPQCRYVVEELGGRISESDWPKVKEIAEKNGLIDGTTFDNLPQQRLHWNCRHSFYPILNKKTVSS